jgi:hypothetical protein
MFNPLLNDWEFSMNDSLHTSGISAKSSHPTNSEAVPVERNDDANGGAKKKRKLELVKCERSAKGW